MLDLLFIVKNVLYKVIPHIVNRAEDNKDSRQAEGGEHGDGDVEEVELSEGDPAGDTLQRPHHTQREQLAGQSSAGGQEVLLGEAHRVGDCSVVLQSHRAGREEYHTGLSSLSSTC